jgi:hypothetical protein
MDEDNAKKVKKSSLELYNPKLKFHYTHNVAVSRWLPTAAARVRSRVWSSGFCGGQSGAGAGFLLVRRFPLPIFIPPNAPQSPSSPSPII